MTDIILSILLSFILTTILAPFVISIVSKRKASQTILHYVDEHQGKKGTPTMGGIAFVIAVTATALTLFKGEMQSGIVAAAIFFGFGVIGFLDDFIKIKFKRNLGLRAYQKIIGQAGIAIIAGVFCYRNPSIGSAVYIPFVMKTIDFGVFIIPFVALVILAMTNSVNLTDGLDGLAGGVSLVSALIFGIIILIVNNALTAQGSALDTIEQNRNMVVLCGAVAGAMFSFLLFNSNPASVFMGDTGSLALGGALACIAVFTKLELLLPIICIMFVLSSISVILQVISFKLTKKRIFLMAPFHHHLQRKGFKEPKIVAFYSIVTALTGAGVILGYLLFFS